MDITLGKTVYCRIKAGNTFGESDWSTVASIDLIGGRFCYISTITLIFFASTVRNWKSICYASGKIW